MGFYISALRANPSSCSWLAAVPQVSLLSATLLAFPYGVIVFPLFSPGASNLSPVLLQLRDEGEQQGGAFVICLLLFCPAVF